MNAFRLLSAAGVLLLLGTAHAPAASHRDRRHPGHRAQVSIATYTTHLRHPARVLRTAHGPAVRSRAGDDVRFAQAARHHPPMRGS